MTAMASPARRAVVLLSGGLDSTTVLAIAMSRGFEAYAMSFRYGQRHVVELEKAAAVAKALGAAQHIVVDIDLRAFGGSALTSDTAVPKGRSEADMAAGIPITYVPARNTIFLSFALAWAEVLGSSDIFVGVNAIDYSRATWIAGPNTSRPTGAWRRSPPRQAWKDVSTCRSTRRWSR